MPAPGRGGQALSAGVASAAQTNNWANNWQLGLEHLCDGRREHPALDVAPRAAGVLDRRPV